MYNRIEIISDLEVDTFIKENFLKKIYLYLATLEIPVSIITTEAWGYQYSY